MELRTDDSGYPDNKFMQSKNSSSIVTSPFQEIRRLRKLLCYNGYYIAFLLGQHTEEEFLKISKKFMEA